MKVRNLLIVFLLQCSFSAVASDSNLQQAIAGKHRTASYVERDRYRHPAKTLDFFGVDSSMTVVEIWPGSGGWYTEILAPYLRKNGKLYAAHFDPQSDSEYYAKSRKKFKTKLADQPAIYDAVEVTTFSATKKLDIAPAGSTDRVLIFRSVHNWYSAGKDEEVKASFKVFYTALKPGGILGVVEHRLPESRPLSDQESGGYMRQDQVIKLAEAAGFKLMSSSEINANPKDTADHPKGVWTLPPTLRLKDENRDHYLSIGESDRMTLKFVKPEDA